MENIIAETILKQLGGWDRLVSMINAKNPINLFEGLSFRFSGSKITNHISIVLQANDTYSIEFGKIREIKYESVKRIHDIYAENLVNVIEDTTGLYLSI
ncbi:hypothetical protein KKG41_01575 [Patescibacteria group bacterium]|nr:hypothetical protein [Patescibacteria group bacterium]